jgi:hypothetical protein
LFDKLGFGLLEEVKGLATLVLNFLELLVTKAQELI